MNLSRLRIRSYPQRVPTWWRTLALALLAMTLAVMVVPATFADPPARVARLSVLSGEVGFAPAGDDNWREANLNRPLVAGDRLYTDGDARTELDLGTAALRLDERSELRLQNLDDQTAQIELTEGTLNLTVRRLHEAQRYEINTPTLALVIREPGAYRVDARDGATQVTVFDGNAEVYGEDDAYQRVTARQSYRFPASSLRDYEVFDLPSPDAFDDWCFARDERYSNPVARQYVSDEVVGYADLDDYGDWQSESDYGPVWYPRRVVSGWAPYREGHWAWVEPWGWTWVDDAPWGFAPSHYGRWVCVRERWGWIPGPARVRPVYAPALVAFIGSDNWSLGFSQGARPVGWYPLGPRDVYEPPYHVSRNYFHNVNVTNIHNHTVINNTVINNVYNNYAGGRPTRGMRHTHRDNAAAVTVVERDTFVNARPVRGAHKRLKPEDLRHATVVARPDAKPTQVSRAPKTPTTRPTRPNRSLEQDVIMRARPAPGGNAAKSRVPERRGYSENASRERKSPRVTTVPGKQAFTPATVSRPERQTPKLDNRQSRVGTRDRAREPQQKVAADTRHARPVAEAPARTSRVPTPTIKQTKVQPRMVVQEPRRPKPVSESISARSQRHRNTPAPTASRRDDRQMQRDERLPRQVIAAPRQGTKSTVSEAGIKKARERQRGKPADTRQGMARGSESVMMMQ